MRTCVHWWADFGLCVIFILSSNILRAVRIAPLFVDRPYFVDTLGFEFSQRRELTFALLGNPNIRDAMKNEYKSSGYIFKKVIGGLVV